MTTPVRALADTLADTLLRADPFAGSSLGRRECDALVPDAGAAAEAALATELDGIAALAGTIANPDDAGDAVTLAVIRSTCDRRAIAARLRSAEYTVSPMPISGAPYLLAVLARTSLQDARAAGDYLERVRGAAGWLAALSERLREGAAVGRFPVAPLVDKALAWTDRVLDAQVPAAVLTPQPPRGWDGESGWREDLEAVARDSLRPALVRWRDRIAEVRPTSRPDDRVGICALPGGAEDYARAIYVHTTLPLAPDELHAIGLEEIERLSERARELGSGIGLADLTAVRAAARASSTVMEPSLALQAAVAAVRRAESRAGEIMPPPLPDPCDVTPMLQTVADAGMAPHYTRPMPDGGRPGTYWFNTLRATAGTGWDLEAVAFHETVPGHHSQLARQQHLAGLPLVQQFSVTAHSEGWGLYAERLAGEFGLYSSVEAEIGAVFVEMHRAARLVVDTGIHALGWSRQRAQQFLVDTVAVSEGFLLDEIDRYIAWPGQALAYLVGQRQILRARARAESALGDGFDLPSFNGALLDSGNVPMDVLDVVVDAWVTAQG